ncbi:hypothetical protein L1987_36147 [Smallanthus sonchifolius]|uniref:Uncharacterized protein n=1 Tax=Smallanthus sonchifolius TaxID=185202 RepID=A0ACB9HDL3_9ASTR|nr:hypothetical protein L1987_36147 [Smallanthus sonchifolius]
MNYLQPNLKHGTITQEEEAIILDLPKQRGSNCCKRWFPRWSSLLSTINNILSPLRMFITSADFGNPVFRSRGATRASA